MVSLPSDPTKGPWATPPELMFTTIFANLSGSKRFTLAQSLDSQALLRACIDCEPFLEFFFKFEEIIVQGTLRTLWGYHPRDIQWQRCVLLQQGAVLNLQETTVKEAITDYLEKFKSRLPSKSQVDDAVKKKNGKGHQKTTDLELETGDKPNWKLVFWFFPNLAVLVSYESMFLENHLARLWNFIPRHFEPSVIASLRAAHMQGLADATHCPNLPTIESVSGQGLRGLVKFCLKRNLLVQREVEHHSRQPLPYYVLYTEDRIDLISTEIYYWLYENYTAEVIEEMQQIYQSLENFLTQLWKCAHDYAIEDAARNAGHIFIIINQNQHLDPDNIGPDSDLIEDVVCKQAVERLLVTLGSPRPKTNRRLNMCTNLAAANLDEFIWYFMESSSINYTVRPTETFRDFAKRWRSETILRQTLGPENYAWMNRRDADFFEKAVREVNGLRQRREDQVRQAGMQIMARKQRKQVYRPKRGWISTIINSVKDMVLRWKMVEPMDEEYDEDGNAEFNYYITMARDSIHERLPPRYPTNSPVPESELGVLQDIVVSKNRLEGNRKHKRAKGIQGRSNRS